MGASIKIGPGCSIFPDSKNGYWYIRFNKKGNSRIRKKLPLQTKEKNKAIHRAHNLYHDWEVGKLDPWHHVEVYVTIEEAIQHYERERGKEIATPEDNIYQLRKLANMNSLTFVREISPKLIRNYVYQPHLSDATKNSYYGKLSAILKWLAGKGYFESDPMAEVAKPKKPRLIPKYWSLDQLDEFLLSAEALLEIRKKHIHRPMRNPLWHRDACELIASTGMRKMEAERLNWQDVVFPGDQGNKRGWIYIRKSKSRRARKITMLPRTEKLLRKLEGGTRLSSDPYEPVLKNGDGTMRKSSDYLSDKFNDVRKFARLPAIGIHGLRHSFAAMLVLAGVDISVIKEEMGHKDIQTTMMYATIGVYDRMNLVYSKMAS